MSLALTIVLIVIQALTACYGFYIQLHPPVKENSRRVELIFGILTLLGVGFGSWLCVLVWRSDKNHQQIDEVITGGESIPQINPSWTADGHVLFPLMVIRSDSKLAVNDFAYRITEGGENCMLHPGKDEVDIGSGQTRPMVPLQILLLPTRETVPSQGKLNNYSIYLDGRNGHYQECLQMKWDSQLNAWDARFTVFKGNVPQKSESSGDWESSAP